MTPSLAIAVWPAMLSVRSVPLGSVTHLLAGAQHGRDVRGARLEGVVVRVHAGPVELGQPLLRQAPAVRGRRRREQPVAERDLAYAAREQQVVDRAERRRLGDHAVGRDVREQQVALHELDRDRDVSHLGEPQIALRALAVESCGHLVDQAARQVLRRRRGQRPGPGFAHLDGHVLEQRPVLNAAAHDDDVPFLDRGALHELAGERPGVHARQ